MEKTLDENEIIDEDEDFYILKMNEESYLQCIHLYFNDDLTEAYFFMFINTDIRNVLK
jgi:hypothetical protein